MKRRSAMKRSSTRGSKDKEDDDRVNMGKTTPVMNDEEVLKTKKKKQKRRVMFSEEPDHVKTFDKRDPVGTDFHALFEADTSIEVDSIDKKDLLQPIVLSTSDIQTTPQKFSLHEFVLPRDMRIACI